MRLSDYFFYTLKEDCKDEDSKSSNLLVRSGMITKIGSGIYSYLPLGLRVKSKIENIIREEMNNAGANELLMPSLIPEDYYVESGRRQNFGSSMFTLKDRMNRNYCLGPTHEELFVTIAKQKIKSYKDLPFNIYQIATKYRDEPRSRYGLIRVREFTMKDAYSFDKDEEGLDVSYQLMRKTYSRIFDRLGLEYKIVKADTGVMGGSLSEEYQAITDIGEDTIVLCDNCDYSSNIEVCEIKADYSSNEEMKEKELVFTEDKKTIEEVANYLNVPIFKLVKTLIYKVDDKFIACLVSGDREVNETKIQKLFKANEVELATNEEVVKYTNSIVGYAGPIDLNIPVVIDNSVLEMKNFVVGANKENYHYINVNIGDFKYNYVENIKIVKEGDICPKCQGRLYFKKGIEVGNIFKIGTKYSESLNLQYLNENNKLQYVVMGCYGIGIGRIMASIAEQNIREGKIVWPKEIAPFEVAIVPINVNNDNQMFLATSLYNDLKTNNVDVVFDDRDERAGVKFNDLELIGIPLRITVGRDAENGLVELLYNEEKLLLSVEEAKKKILEIFSK